MWLVQMWLRKQQLHFCKKKKVTAWKNLKTKLGLTFSYPSLLPGYKKKTPYTNQINIFEYSCDITVLLLMWHTQGSSGPDDMFDDDSYSLSSLSSSSSSSIHALSSMQGRTRCTACGLEILDRYLLKVRERGTDLTLNIMQHSVTYLNLENIVLEISKLTLIVSYLNCIIQSIFFLWNELKG